MDTLAELRQEFEDLRQSLASGTGVVDTGWRDLGLVATYGTNWGPFASDDFRPMIRRLPTGQVLLRGLVAKAAALAGAAETICTFPRDWQNIDPGYNGTAPIPIFDVAASGAVATQLRLYNSGLLQRDVGGSATWISLTGVSWFTTL